MRRAIPFVFATVLLDMLALGLIAPVLPRLILGFTHGDQASAAHTLGLFGSVFALMQFTCSPMLGMLSDRFGRRPVILLSNFGLSLDYIFMALAPGLGWLFAGRVVAGITSASMGTASAYVADSAEPQQRAADFGLLGVACGLGFVAGPALGGVLGKYDPHLPFWFAAALSMANAIYGLLVLPESLHTRARRAIVWHRANPLAALHLLWSRPQLRSLSIVAFVNALAGVALPILYALYVEDRYQWNPRTTGLSLMLLGVCSLLAQATLVKPAVACFGERGTILAGLLAGAVGMCFFAMAPTSAVFLWGVPCLALWGLAPVAALSVMTRCVGATEQGRLQGALASLTSLAALVGPELFTNVYARSFGNGGVAHPPGAAWMLSALMLLLAGALMLRIKLPAASDVYCEERV